jgi:hypothetical protein
VAVFTAVVRVFSLRESVVVDVDKQTSVPGQTVLPTMAGELGYDSASAALKPWEERFCWKYVELGVAVRAYQAVKPKSTYGTARSESAKLLAKPSISARIAEIQEEIGREAKALVMGYHRSVMTVDRIALLQKVNDAKSLEELDTEARSILEFEQVNSKDGVRTLLKVPTRHQSAVELARITGMHKERTEVTGKDGGPIQTKETVTIYIPSNGRD